MAKFVPGTSGNPAGRKMGTLNKRTQLFKLLDKHAEELIAILVNQAKAGDPNALKLCVERILPRPRPEGPSITLPQVDNTLPNRLDHFKVALLDMLTCQEQVDLEAVKVIVELVNLCKAEKLENSALTESDHESVRSEMAELLAKYHRDTI